MFRCCCVRSLRPSSGASHASRSRARSRGCVRALRGRYDLPSMSLDAAAQPAAAPSLPDHAAARTFRNASWFWSAIVVAVTAPLLLTLCAIIWRTPMPLSEAVALLEDVARRPALSFLSLDTSYYRPLYHMTLSLLWHRAGSLAATLSGIKRLQIVPVVALVLLLVRSMAPRNGRDAAAALVAVAVLLGMPAFRDNIELPLSYTTVGMPIALAIWLLLDRPAARWH